jgi:hypothetical protein
VKNVSKNSEGTITGVDIHGRLEALDQSVRSVEGRLRAVERRLSYDLCDQKGRNTENPALQEYDICDEIEELSGKVANLAKSMDEIKNDERLNALGEIKSKVESTRAELIETSRNYEQKLKVLSDTERRLERLENANKITIGKIKVPLELSGLIAAFVLLVTGYLIFADKWSIIRSSYYPITIGIIFGAVVIAKFLLTNKNTG